MTEPSGPNLRPLDYPINVRLLEGGDVRGSSVSAVFVSGLSGVRAIAREPALPTTWSLFLVVNPSSSPEKRQLNKQLDTV